MRPLKQEPYPEMPLHDYIKVMQRRFGPPKQKKHPYERYSASIDHQSQTLLLPSLSTLHESNYDMEEHINQSFATIPQKKKDVGGKN